MRVQFIPKYLDENPGFAFSCTKATLHSDTFFSCALYPALNEWLLDILDERGNAATEAQSFLRDFPLFPFGVGKSFEAALENLDAQLGVLFDFDDPKCSSRLPQLKGYGCRDFLRSNFCEVIDDCRAAQEQSWDYWYQELLKNCSNDSGSKEGKYLAFLDLRVLHKMSVGTEIVRQMQALRPGHML